MEKKIPIESKCEKTRKGNRLLHMAKNMSERLWWKSRVRMNLFANCDDIGIKKFVKNFKFLQFFVNILRKRYHELPAKIYEMCSNPLSISWPEQKQWRLLSNSRKNVKLFFLEIAFGRIIIIIWNYFKMICC